MEGIVQVAARRCGVTGRNRYRGTPRPHAGPTPAPAGSGGSESGQQLRLL